MLISEIRTRLVDEKSRIIFDARNEYRSDKRLSVFYNNIKPLGDIYIFREVDKYISDTGISSFYIWGSNDYCIYSYHVLKDCGYMVEGIVNYEQNEYIPKDIPFFSVEEIKDKLGKKSIIVFQRDNDAILQRIQLDSNILKLRSHVVGRTGKQYYDFFVPNGKEYFVDAGCLDGMTTKNFIEWCNGNYGAVYAFEANPIMVSECKKNMEQFVDRNKLFFYDIALWDRQEDVLFENRGSIWDAHIDANGKEKVKANSIDNILGTKKVTYIKLDIEGSELKALYGAKECILLNHPRMAISVYHNDSELFGVMEYLIQLDVGYNFALRHYHSDTIETVLYVF